MSKYVIHIGMSGYPNVSAPVQRIKLTFKGLKQFGFFPFVINKHSYQTREYKAVNREEGIPFLFTSLKSSRPKSYIFRNINKISGVLGEACFLFRKRKKIHTAFLYTPSFYELVYYRAWSKVCGFQLVIQYVELRSSIDERDSLLVRINDRLFDNYFHWFCDGVIAISDFLVQHIHQKNSQLPVIKIPAMVDFDEFTLIQPLEEKPYLMYCCSITYDEVIKFVIDIFIILKTNYGFDGDLRMVISGNHEGNWRNVNQKVKESGFGNNIRIKSNIPYNELLSLYKGAEVLLIPLRNTVQDTARFPHKIGEYTASERPIVSTRLGELNIYFKDGINAILAEEYSVDSYVKKLAEVLPEKVKLDSVGKNGFELGKEHFDYRSQTLRLKEFICNI